MTALAQHAPPSSDRHLLPRSALSILPFSIGQKQWWESFQGHHLMLQTSQMAVSLNHTFSWQDSPGTICTSFFLHALLPQMALSLLPFSIGQKQWWESFQGHTVFYHFILQTPRMAVPLNYIFSWQTALVQSVLPFCNRHLLPKPHRSSKRGEAGDAAAAEWTEALPDRGHHALWGTNTCHRSHANSSMCALLCQWNCQWNRHPPR